MHKIFETFVVDALPPGIGKISFADAGQALDIVKGKSANAYLTNKGRPDGVRLDRALQLPDRNADYVGKYLAPNIGVRTPANHGELIERLAEKAIKLRSHPSRVQCNTFQEGTYHVLTGMLQREVQQASPQTRVVNRAPFPEQPGGIKQTSCSRWNGCRNFVQNGIGIGRPLSAKPILMEEDLVAEESEIRASRRLHSNRQIAPGYRTRHRRDLRTHICFFEGNMRLNPRGCSDVKMSLAIPNCSRPDGSR